SGRPFNLVPHNRLLPFEQQILHFTKLTTKIELDKIQQQLECYRKRLMETLFPSELDPEKTSRPPNGQPEDESDEDSDDEEEGEEENDDQSGSGESSGGSSNED